MGKMLALPKSRGSALIIALSMVALVAAMATLMQLQQRISIRRTSLLVNNERAAGYAEGTVEWARALLLVNAQKGKPNSLIDKLPTHLNKIKINDTVITAVLTDLQSRFNVNNLIEKKYVEQFARLMTTVEPNLGETQALFIATACQDWVTQAIPNETPIKGLPNFADIYRKNDPSYQAPHQPMASITELRLVAGMTDQLYLHLLPHITALPMVTRININTASAPVLATLGQLPLSTARSLAQTARTQPFTTLENFMAAANGQTYQIPADQITLESNYFLVQSLIQIGHQQLTQYALLSRSRNQNPEEQDILVDVLWQSQGTL